MKRRILALLGAALMAVCLLLPLSGCHGRRQLDSFSVPESFDASRNYVITFWAKNDTNKTQIHIYEKAIEDFQTLYPNVTVKLRLYTDYGRIYNDVITNIATGTTPNVCITYPDHVATYLTGDNTVVPLDDLLANEKYGPGGSELRFDGPTREEIIPKLLEEGNFSGSHYVLPFMRSTEACYVNKTYVEKLGFTLPETLTWDFVWQVSEAAMAKDEDGSFLVNGQKVLIPFIYKSTDNMMIQLLRQYGGGYSTEEGEILLFNDVTSSLLLEIARHGKTRAFSTFKISSYPANFLNAGQCIFAVDSTAGATWMGSEAPLSDISEDSIVSFETAVMTVPQADPGDPSMISQGPSVCIFNKTDPQEVLASWLFAQYLLTNDVQLAYAQTEGYVPVTTRARQDPAYQDYLSRGGEDGSLYYDVKIQASRLLLDHLEDTFVTPVFNGSASLRDAAGMLIEKTVNSVRRGETVDRDYLTRLYADVTAMYRLDQLGASDSQAGNRQELGPLPAGARALLVCLVVVWVILGSIWLRNWVKDRQKGKK